MKKLLLIMLFTISISAQSYNILLFSDAGVSYQNAETLQYAGALTTPLSDAAILRIDTLITMLKDSLAIVSLTSKFDLIYIMANETEEAALKNLVKRSHDGTLVSTPTFAQWEGYTTASGKYINMHYNQYTDSVNLKRYSGSFGIYIRTDELSNETDMGASNNWIASGYAVGESYARITSAGSVTLTSVTTSKGFSIASRTDAGNQNIYQNITKTASGASAGQATLNKIFVIGGYNYTDAPGIDVTGIATRQYSFAFIGGGLTATEVRQLTNCVEWYMDRLGKGVIP